MKKSIDLIGMASVATALSDGPLVMKRGHDRTILCHAQRAGSLSPLLAIELSPLAGEEPKQWIALAAIETEKPKGRRAALLGAVRNF